MMRPFSLSLASAVTLISLFVAREARAVVHEPNGLAVPQPAPGGETSLNVFFAGKGEAIDWQADAQTTPNAFSPLCAFTSTFVLNDAGSHFGLAWYNDTGQTPLASDLHILVPANSPVGTTFQGTSIKQDPAYAGGLIGFALVGGETHYINASYDKNCSGCNPPGPWITALMYASKNTPNAYYICFEDGGTSASGWNNDGDFNDDVFFLTGITCSGGGQTCDTGLPGVCASGVTQCTANGITCQQLTQPAAETCNGLDDDCNGVVDEGNSLCATDQVCDKGTCVKKCMGAEFPCPSDKVCNTNGYCVDPACETVNCPSGQVCIQGTCKGPCDGVTCPYSQVCLAGVCKDPCASVTCASGEVCDGGACVTSCTCLPCTGGNACDTVSGNCVEPTCVGIACGAGTHCVAGGCVEDCAGAVCPFGQGCIAGVCTAIATGSGGSGPSSTGTGLASGSGGGGSASGTTAGGSGGANGNGGSGAGIKTNAGGCGCELASDRDPVERGLAMAGVALGLAALRRRRTAKGRVIR